MEQNNRFTYFSDIEEHFCRRRGAALICSTLDWSLMEIWKDAGIPLEVVLRGIDTAFDRYDARPSKTTKINGLAWCSQAVLAAAEEMKEAAVGATRIEQSEAGFAPAQVAEYLRRNAAQLEALLAGMKSPVLPTPARPIVQDTARSLHDLAQAITDAKTANLEDLERRLTVMEEKFFAVLLASTPDEELVEVRAEADRELAPYRRKMIASQIDQLHRQYVQKRLLERYRLPRLSLFYM